MDADDIGASHDVVSEGIYKMEDNCSLSFGRDRLYVTNSLSVLGSLISITV